MTIRNTVPIFVVPSAGAIVVRGGDLTHLNTQSEQTALTDAVIARIVGHGNGDWYGRCELSIRSYQVNVVLIVLVAVGRRFKVGWRNERKATNSGNRKGFAVCTTD